MKIGITRKLFLAVFSTVVFAVALVGVATRWSFTHNFLDYLNELAVERLDFAAVRAGQAYTEHGNWDFLHRNQNAWFEVMRPERAQERPTDKGLQHKIPTSDLTGAVMRLGLIDIQEQWIVGYRDVDTSMLRRPVISGGKTVGWVVLASFQSVTDAGSQRFQEDQYRATLLASVIAVALSAMIALWLARALLAPVRRVAQATHQLAAGHYETRVNLQSQDEVGQLASDFNHLAQTLQRNEAMRREFMADVSHELRTPLAVLRGELEAMEDGIRPLTPAALQSLQTEVATLSKLVGDLYELSLSDVGALAYRMQEVDLETALLQAIDGMRTRIAQHDLHIVWQAPEQLHNISADAARLQQLFQNLLENSLRYTHAGGELHIDIQEVGDSLQINFQDTAPGVEAAMLPRLFERFFRTDSSRTRTTGGAGLGLAICRNIVEAHGGSISAQASPFGGVWIAIRLPRSR